MTQILRLPNSTDVAYRCLKALEQYRELWVKCETKYEKLVLLRRMADVSVWHYESRFKTAAKRRKAFNKRKPRIKSGAKCKVCKSVEAMVRHHIIALKNGGTNRTQNILAICWDCHAEIHPWLKR